MPETSDLLTARRARPRIPVLGPACGAVIHWFRDVPISDPVDRRNAPVLQLIALLLAILPSLAWLYRAFMVDVPWRPGELGSMVFSLTVCAASAVSFVLIRYGRFAWASWLLLMVFAITVIPAYAGTGFEAQRFEQPVLVIWMAIAGLIIGRGALWLMFASIVVAFVLGTAVDVSHKGDPASYYADAAFSAAMFLMIAVVMDRSAAALRESLREANLRGSALAFSNQLLEEEIRQREQAQEQLIHAQKVEAVGRLASGVAHDFGNLLSLILGYAARGRRASELEQAREALGGVESAARRATLVTHKLLAFSRQDETRAQAFDPAEALRELRPMLRQLFDPAIELQLDLQEPLPAILFDRTQFELMALNIAANANHAMRDGGRFDLVARGRDDGGLTVEFRDTGHGMSAEVQARAFEPFFTTKPAGEGTGLGLSVARDLVQRAGGQLELDSAPGQGTRLRLHLPAAPA